MPPTAVLDRSPIEEAEEVQTSDSVMDQVLEAFPEKLDQMTLEEIVETRDKVVDILIENGVTTREKINSGEAYASKTGTALDNAELLQEGAYETKDGRVEFKPEVIQQVFANWQTRMGEATAVAGDDFKVEQNVTDDNQQFETGFGGSIDMMLRGLDMNIALAKKDERFLTEAQGTLSDVRTETEMVKLATEHPDKEFIVTQTRPYVHTLLERAGEDFVKRRHYSGEGDKTAMHFTYKISGGKRTMMQTVINGDSLEVWDEVYGDEATSDIDRLNSLKVEEVTGQNIDHTEAHVMSVANIDQVQSRITGELTHAGVAVESLEKRQELYDQAVARVNETEARNVENSHKMTQLSIEIAESIITGEMAEGVKESIREALGAKTSDGKNVLDENVRHLFEQVLEEGALTQVAASVLQSLEVMKESAASTQDLDRLSSLLGPEEAANVLAGKSIQAAALDAYATGKRAGGCPGADEETVVEEIKKQYFEQKKAKEKGAWYDEMFNGREVEELNRAERVIVQEFQAEQHKKAFTMLNEVLQDEDSEVLERLFAIGGSFSGLSAITEGSQGRQATEETASWLDVEPAYQSQMILKALLTNELSTPSEDGASFELDNDELAVVIDRIQQSIEATLPDSLEKPETVADAYKIWLVRKLDIIKQQIENGEEFSEEFAESMEVLSFVIALAESDIKFEENLSELLLEMFEDTEFINELTEDQEIIADILGKLQDPEKRQEIIEQITEAMSEINEQLSMDLMLEKISPETANLMQEILGLEEIDGESLFTDKEKEVINQAIAEGKLSIEAAEIIRKYVLFKQLESLIADELVRIKLVNHPKTAKLLELVVKNADLKYIVENNPDILVSSQAAITDEKDKDYLHRLLGMIALSVKSSYQKIADLSHASNEQMQIAT